MFENSNVAETNTRVIKEEKEPVVREAVIILTPEKDEYYANAWDEEFHANSLKSVFTTNMADSQHSRQESDFHTEITVVKMDNSHENDHSDLESQGSTFRTEIDLLDSEDLGERNQY